MRFMKRLSVAALLLILSLSSAGAQTPLLVLGGSAMASTSSADPGLTPSMSVSADCDWRVPVGATGYTALWISGALTTYPLSLEFVDTGSVAVEIGATPSGIHLEASASLDASTGLLDSAAWFAPAWEFSLLIPVAGNTLAIGPVYGGSYDWLESDSFDVLENRAVLRTVLEPSFASAYHLDLGASLEWYPAVFVTAPDGSLTDQARRDVAASAAFYLDYLSGYFTRWTASLSGGAQFSNATRYLPSSGVAESASEDRRFLTATATLRLSPSRSLSVDLGISSDAALYSGHVALDSDGNPIGENLAYVRAAANATAAFTPNNRIFIIGSLAGMFSASNDPDYSGWSASGGLSVEWRL